MKLLLTGCVKTILNPVYVKFVIIKKLLYVIYANHGDFSWLQKQISAFDTYRAYHGFFPSPVVYSSNSVKSFLMY